MGSADSNKAVLSQCSVFCNALDMALSAADCVYICGLASGVFTGALLLYSTGGQSPQTLYVASVVA